MANALGGPPVMLFHPSLPSLPPLPPSVLCVLSLIFRGSDVLSLSGVQQQELFVNVCSAQEL